VTKSRHRSLLVLLVLIWAVSWPVIKMGVAATPPIWFSCLRYAIAAASLFAFVIARGGLRFPPRGDWPLIAVSGVLQMAAYSALTGTALTVLPPGRASILAFSTPIWVVPISAWRLGERMSGTGLLGVGLGLGGILAIAAPSLLAAGTEAVAYGLLLAAAAAWAVSIVFVRSHRFTADALSLAPWQMLVAFTLLLPVALMKEGPPPYLRARSLLSLSYVAPVATAFAYWGVVETGRRFPASTVSMALLATPALGLLISAVVFREPVGVSLLVGLALIGAGIWLATRVKAPARPATRIATRTG
jgi:drug/metabolite transporter (DMT)-like permease